MEQIAFTATLSESDQRQIILWNGAEQHATEECIHNLIQRQAQRTPDALALQGWDASYNFQELETNALTLCSHLVTLGVGPDVLVPLCFENSALNVVVMLAVLKAGGAYLSIDSTFPLDRIRAIIETSKAHLILSSEDHAHKLRHLLPSIVVIDLTFLTQLTLVHEPSWPDSTPNAAAYAIFTSGTTGIPKGIIIEHRSLSTMALANGKKLGMGKESRVLQFASHTFDASIIEIFLTLVHGGCVCIPTEHERMNDLAGYMHRNGINWAILTPTVASLLHPQDIPALEYLAIGGEAPREDVFMTWSSSTTLLNLYGPAECTVMAAFCEMHASIPLKTIGRGIASRLWIVDQNDHQRLCPVGIVGELLIEGPIVGRGYINDSERTASVFVDMPSWIPGESETRRRFYRTGDLVKYNTDGSILFLGRQDDQIKIHGQRVELSDIESSLAVQEPIRHCSVLFPNHGHLKGKLVAILSLSNIPESSSDEWLDSVSLVDVNLLDTNSSSLSTIKERLSSRFPRYMLPTVWVVVKKIPLTTSKKIDKKRLEEWLNTIDRESLRQIMSTERRVDSKPVVDEMERQFFILLEHVLNIDREKITPHNSFFDLGGDSITAMQLVARCRAVGLSLSVRDILKSETIAELIRSLTSLRLISVPREEKFNTTFNLSPIQQMYFEKLRDHNQAAQPPPFTQFYMLQFSKKMMLQDIENSVKRLVGRHSLLRGRFTKSDDGVWVQRILPAVEGTYHFGAHQVGEYSDVYPHCARSHDSMDLVQGPVFAVDFFQISTQEQLIFLVAHHAVIDVVSWRIIFKDLETMLTSGELSADPLPFQTWARLQEAHARINLYPQKALPYKITPAQINYWGMQGVTNLHGDRQGINFEIDQDLLQTLFNGYRHAIRADPVDVYIASLLQSFNSVFTDREVPTVFNEGHGRESWDSQLDVSDTVGWFTTMYPIQVKDRVTFDQLVQLVKDQRESLPNKGWSYFTCRYLNEDGRREFAQHWPLEVNLNYIGHYQQLERRDSLLQAIDFDADEIIGSGLDSQPRLALFEISVSVIQGKARIFNVFNRKMRHKIKISEWMLSWKTLLFDKASHYQRMARRYTQSDFPLVSLSTKGIKRINKIAQKLDKGCEIEDIYPCAPIQLGMLLSQARSPIAYRAKLNFEVLALSGAVDCPRIQLACERVVQHHAMLRTVFVESISNSPYDQMVLQGFIPKIEHVIMEDDDVADVLDLAPNYIDSEMKPPYQFTIITNPVGKLFLILSISHALIDATSIGIISRDLSAAYDDKLSQHLSPKYSTYIRHIQEEASDKALGYWASYLKDVNSTYFPCLNDGFQDFRDNEEIDVDMTEHLSALISFCKRNKTTASNVFLVVWGIVLRSLNNADQIIFGYTTSGRDIPLNGIEDAVGPYINMLICRMQISNSDKLLNLVEKRREEYIQSLPYQHTPLADIQHNLKLSQERLFNTTLSFQRSSSSPQEGRSISLEQTVGKDPSEVGYL
jgi:amino acid adenylation domain-containing protein/non-ribosomal peptide synthase protein (TIGR01720 family)